MYGNAIKPAWSWYVHCPVSIKYLTNPLLLLFCISSQSQEIWILSLEQMVSGTIFILLFFKTSYIAQYAMQLVILRKKTHANMHMYTNRHTQANFFVLFLAWGDIPLDFKIRIFCHASEQSGKLRPFFAISLAYLTSPHHLGTSRASHLELL